MYVEEIDVGESKPRQIVSALAKHVTLSDMIGRLVVVLCNIRPAKRMDIMSYGLLLGATSEDHLKVEPVDPPNFAKAGDKISVQGFVGEPDPVIDINLYDEIAKYMRSNNQGTVIYQGIPMTTSSGNCTVKSLFNVFVS